MTMLILVDAASRNIVAIIVLVIVAGLIARSRWVKGLAGEYRLRLIARFALDRDVYHGFHGVMLRTPDGVTQIDHVFVSRIGIFVVETKNMRGWIFGSERDARWTQSIYGAKFSFQNPLRQNFKHVKAVEQALQVPPEAIHSVVAFVGAATFRTAVPANVTSGSGFSAYIRRFQVQVFTEAQVSGFLNSIEKEQLSSGHALRTTHVSRLRQRSDPNARRRCPKCGSRLIVRTAKRGFNAGNQFWACSTYPKCKFAQDIAAPNGKRRSSDI